MRLKDFGSQNEGCGKYIAPLAPSVVDLFPGSWVHLVGSTSYSPKPLRLPGIGGIRTDSIEKFATKMVKPNPPMAKGNPCPKSFPH